MRRLLGLTFTLALFGVSPVHAQVGYDTPHGRVEVIGLNRWTLRQLRDSLKAKRPGLELEDAACMAVLRNELHFPDALVLLSTYQASADDSVRHFVVVKLAEPKDRGRIHWRMVSRDSTVIVRPEYASVVTAVLDSSGVLWPGRVLGPLSLYRADSAQREQLLARAAQQTREDAHRLWAFLDAHRGENDWRRAVRVLESDASHADRVVAAAILANFGDRNVSWYALVEALRDPDETVRAVASLVLYSYPRRVIDWTPETETLRYLLGGTNVRVTDQLFGLLASTGIRPALAKPLLRGNMQWIIPHLRSSYPPASGGARAFLTQLNAGRDLGADPLAWIRWSRAL